jgi:hypothetical protein
MSRSYLATHIRTSMLLIVCVKIIVCRHDLSPESAILCMVQRPIVLPAPDLIIHVHPFSIQWK